MFKSLGSRIQVLRSIHSHIHCIVLVMSELDHLRKKPPDGGLPLDIKDRKLRDQCQECGVTFYIGPEETSQQTSERRESLGRSIKTAKTKMRRLAERGSAREQDDD